MISFSDCLRPRNIVTAAITSLALLGSALVPPAAAQDRPAQAFSRQKLEQLAAPIALYPDRLLTQILMASTYPLDVVQAARWRQANAGVRGGRLEQVLQSQPWDESVKALTAVPDVLRMMNARLDWTEQLGEAFLAQEDELLAAVQALRRRAETAGHLRSTRQLRVVHSESYIILEPVDPEVIYVPVYEPDVYGVWPYSDYPLTAWWYPGRRHRGEVIWFASAVAIGAALWARWDWRRRHVAIDRTRFNRFNRANIATTTWQHDPQRRRGAPYKAPVLAEKFKDVKGGPRQGAGRAERSRDASGVRERSREREAGPPAATKTPQADRQADRPGRDRGPAVTAPQTAPRPDRSAGPTRERSRPPGLAAPRMERPPPAIRRATPPAIARPPAAASRPPPAIRSAPPAAASRPAPQIPKAGPAPRAPAAPPGGGGGAGRGGPPQKQHR